MLTDTTRSPYAKVHALDGMKVKWTGGLWKERFDTCANSTVPQLKHMFDSKEISHVVENFKICAGDAEGGFDGTVLVMEIFINGWSLLFIQLTRRIIRS